jgi:thiamine kinase-like enzyme
MEGAAPQFRILFADQTTPLIRRAFPTASVDSLMTMWQSREVHVQILERLPQTLVHGDAQPSNLFLIRDDTGGQEIAAIDWNTVGMGPVGLDAAQLFGFILGDSTIPVDQFADVAQRIYASYLAGVQDSGWRGDPSVVRLGYTASMIRVRMMFVMRTLQIFLDETLQKRIATQLQAYGITLEYLADRVPHIEQCVSTLFEESFVLRDQLS